MFPSLNPRVDCPNVQVLGGNSANVCAGAALKESKSKRCSRFFDCLLPFTRAWGILTAVVLGGVGADLAFHKHRTGYYLIGESVFVFLVEVTWVVTLFMQLCVRNDSKVWKCWSVVTWLETWKKALVYAPMGSVPLIWPHKFWLSYVAAGQLIALAIFHLALSFKDRRKRRKRKERLLHEDADSFESSKFEEVTEVLDDGLPEPIPGSSHSLSDSLAEQDTILEI